MTTHDISNTRINHVHVRGYQIQNYKSWDLDQWEHWDPIPINYEYSWMILAWNHAALIRRTRAYELIFRMNQIMCTHASMCPCPCLLAICMYAHAHDHYHKPPPPMIRHGATMPPCHHAPMPPCTLFLLISVPRIPFGATHCHKCNLTLSLFTN